MEERSGESKWKSLRRLLSFKSIGCCGNVWGSTENSNLMVLSDVEEYEESSNQQPAQYFNRNQEEIIGTNLASALAAERQFRATEAHPSAKVSLMRLLEENERTERNADVVEVEEVEEVEEEVSNCCVCMVRMKGSAFIPCGHTFCRTCSREVWSCRQSCPLCNQTIVEILDIY